ncbi:carbohydrate-binding protein [Desertifilum sp. FACHB-1129]|uniref:CBM6 domain-containing protein n=2 Tax=Desertifilum tharense IPPAS B-1220 TaxID=1781255 RepID=A0A1E5QQ62_9CYAN|nr:MULTISPECIES: carbohydrate-binding domain-containing protein [Desertifilum]MDA0211073.1 DUF5010 C-terminal domain-containing protein [Cyanobacteria bacterium FC1]MBD2312675.1 carbohydrate-binding protein [Desertifilum sp. FACHB-1129]MBD2320156.1 carbohydrate-binding protein [Desertifilum sp. FACHB-866]MBD2330284.1 carbohydrate-binding protein [Desertifilum sp. FACHB-868]OEJ76473.1 hypothetical protein BH720_03755 [Desertifilum tharense IPPAS B-1220]
MAVKIMPLGDSNTRGHNQAPAGYRNRLWNSLSLSGFEVDFVGSQVTGTTPTLGDPDHEGRGGWRIDQISANVTNWLNQQQPDIVLLMIGTNDILQQYQVNTAPNRLNTLIDQILDWSSNVQILVGSIIPITRSTTEYQQVLDFNATIPGIVNSKNSQVQFIDIFSAVSDQDLTDADGVHPTEFGYNKIAQAWYDALISSPTLASTHSEPLPIRIEAEDYINYYDTTPNNQGGQYRTDGVDIQVTSDARGGYNVGWTAPGEWLAYEVNIPAAGTYDVVFRVASGQAGTKSLQFQVNGQSIGNALNFTNASGWQSWQNLTLESVNLQAGVQQLGVLTSTGNFNLNYIDLIPRLSSVPDTTAPNANLSATNVTTAGNEAYTFSVTYSDNVAIAAATLDSSDVRVMGPDGFSQLASLVSVNSSQNGTPRVATYRITPPGGSWAFADNGTYSIVMEANQVSDTSNNFVAAGELGNFSVNIASPAPTPTPTPTPAASIRIQAEDYKPGGQGVGYFDTTHWNQGGVYRTQEAVDVGTTLDQGGGFMVGWTAPGEWLAYDLTVPQAGTYDLVVRIASGSTNPVNKQFYFTFNGQNLTGTQTYSDFSGWESWQNFVIPGIQLNAGQQEMRFHTTTGKVNLNYFDLIPVETSIPTDTTPPTANLSVTNVTAAGDEAYTFSVTYSDDVAIAATTLDSSDVRVIGPDGFSQLASLVSVNSSQNGTPRVATYRITPPGGSWAFADNGTYSIVMEANQVSDTSNNFVAAGELGSFTVNIASPPPTPTPTPTPAPILGTPIRIEAENYKSGGPGVGYYDTTNVNQGGQYRFDHVDIEITTDVGGGYNVGWTAAGEWLAYDVDVPATGRYNLVSRIASGSTSPVDKRFHFTFNGENVTGSLTYSGTSGWQTWTNLVASDIQLTEGRQEMRVYMETGKLNLNYFELVPILSSPEPSPTPTPTPGEQPNPLRIEAESLVLTNYVIEDAEPASNGQLISLFQSGSMTGTAAGTFTGPTGTYEIRVGYFDETDGQSSVGLTISGQTYNWTFDQWLWDSWVTERTKTSRTLAAEVLLETGTPFSFSGTADQAEWARLDYIEFIPVGDWSGFMPPDELTGGGTRTGSVFAIALGEGFDTIVDFTLGEDWIGLMQPLTFEQLDISQGTGEFANSTLIKAMDSNELLAILQNIQADSLTPADFKLL